MGASWNMEKQNLPVGGLTLPRDGYRTVGVGTDTTGHGDNGARTPVSVLCVGDMLAVHPGINRRLT